ncbi:MAG: hypothetical protein MK098_05095 [Marinovum sp.]|nr:hypothetical protein [Marinovum sp.]
MSRVFDVQLPFFIPIWRRIALTLFVGVWAIFEWTLDNQILAILTGMIAVYLALQFFVFFDPKTPEEKENEQ